jgi:uncharacterized protein YjbI with pentapeptide repeats
MHRPQAWFWVGEKLRWLLSGRTERWLPLRLSIHVLMMVCLALLAAVVIWDFFAARFPSPLPASLKVDVVRLVMYVIAGLGGVIALVIAYRRQGLGEAAAVLEQAADSREQSKAFNEQFAAAAEQLSSDKAANRLAGVYAMADLADDWDRGRQTCINVLCAYMRMPYDPREIEPDWENGDASKRHQEHRAEHEVRRTVMDVIGERLRADPIQGKTWHGHDFDFSGTVLDSGNLRDIKVTGGLINFAGAEFSRGQVSFSGAEFSGGQVSFADTKFSGSEVHFLQVEFCGGEVDFSRMKVTGGEVAFGEAKFSDGLVAFFNAEFSSGEVDFFDAEFCGGRVAFFDAEFSGGYVAFSGAEFSDGDAAFHRAKFSGAQVDFSATGFSGSQVAFNDAEFSGGQITFGKAGFSGGGVAFFQTKFSGAQVHFGGASFSAGRVDFFDAKFSGGQIDLSTAKFSGAYIHFSEAAFSGAQVDFSGAEFSGSQVDFRYLREWSQPPVFDPFPEGTPAGLLLPGVETSQVSDGSVPIVYG